MNFRFPVFLDLTAKKCLVTGEGYEIAGKVQALADAGAVVIYVNSSAEPAIAELAETGRIRWERRSFKPADLDNCFLVIADLEDNAEIFRLAEEQKVLCNSVDDPPHCRFSFGSIHRQGELTIAISTNGWAPAVAVRLRQRIEREIGPEYKTFMSLLKSVRAEIGERISDFGQRRDLWYRIVDSEALNLIAQDDETAAQRTIRDLIEETVNSISRSRISVDSASE